MAVDKDRKRAAALRENLLKRKRQVRERDEDREKEEKKEKK